MGRTSGLTVSQTSEKEVREAARRLRKWSKLGLTEKSLYDVPYRK